MLEKYPEPRYYNQSNHVWRFPGGKRIELGYLDNDKDVFRYQGAEIDGFFPDELTQFPRDWYLYLFSRIRTTRRNQRMRVLATTNPGGENEAWVKERWGPWLDKRHPRPARSGEIRWFRRVESASTYAEEEVPASHDSVGCECRNPKHSHAWSRTFIRAGVKDNPFVGGEYVRNLDMLPEPHRSQLRDGDWNVGSKDSEWQVIPTRWIELAQDRWRQRATAWLDAVPTDRRDDLRLPPVGSRPYTDDELALARPPDQVMTGYGLDVARGGNDWTVHVPEYVDFYAWPIKHPGADTPDGLVIAEQVASIGITHNHVLPDGVPVNVDIVGVGSSPFDILRANGFNVHGLNGGAGSDKKDKSGVPFANKRAEWYWSLREELDPNSGANLALPPHPEVLPDLAASRWRVLGGKITIEPKDEIKKRIGRSPDVGDTIVYAHARDAGAGTAVVGFYSMFAEQVRQG